MLTSETLEKALSLLDKGHTFASIMEETGITLEDVEAVHVAWFRGTTEQLFRELQLADVLELAATRLRSGQGWDEGTTGDVLREMLHVYREYVKKALIWRLPSIPNLEVSFGRFQDIAGLYMEIRTLPLGSRSSIIPLKRLSEATQIRLGFFGYQAPSWGEFVESSRS